MIGLNDFSNVQIRHFLPRRIRVKVSYGFRDAHDSQTLAAFLGKMEAVQRVTVRSFSGSVIFHLSRDQTSADAFREALQHFCHAHFSELLQRLNPTRNISETELHPFPFRDADEDSSASVSILSLASLGALLVAAFIKRIFWGSAVAQGPFSAAGIVSLTAAALMWRKKVRDQRRHHRPLIPLLNGAALVAVVASRALTAAEILFVGHVSLWLEAKSEQRAARYLAESFPALPQPIDVVEGDSVRSRSLSEITVGDVIVVEPGRVVPVDGTVWKGSAAVDESHLTGRTLPRVCDQGSPVFAGSHILEGTLYVITEKSAQETALARIQSLVLEGLRQRTALERRAEVYSRKTFTMGLWATAATLATTLDVQRALSVFLVMTCPCAMVLAASSVVTTAVAALMRRAVVVKSGRSLEMAPVVDAVCFDKTGTLTAGILSVREVYPRAPWMNREELLALAAAAEKGSPHPVAVALRHAAGQAGQEIPPAEDQEIYPGRGVRARVEDDTVLVGNESFVREHGVSVGYFAKKASEHRRQGGLVVYLAKNKRLQALVILMSSAPGDLRDFLNALRKDGVQRIELLSGDSFAAARRFAEGLPFDGCLGDLDPEGKAYRVQHLQTQGYRVAMIGDGINDAPALSRADLGVALGPHGAAAALETADAVLLDGDVRKFILLRRTGRRMLELAQANFLLATSSNIIGAVAAVTGMVGPAAAGLLHVVHTGVILANAARMFRMDWEDVTALSQK